jgi:hypothetical protein
LICLNYYCSSKPKISSSIIKETGNIRHNISFIIRCLPCFNEIYLLFYNNKVKIVPLNIGVRSGLINVSLAYWIMSDGGWIGLGIRLFVNSFTKPGPPCGAWVFKREPFPPSP